MLNPLLSLKISDLLMTVMEKRPLHYMMALYVGMSKHSYCNFLFFSCYGNVSLKFLEVQLSSC